MPLTYRFINDGQGAIFTASGVLTGTEVADAYSEIIAAVRAKVIPYYFNLFDLDRVTGIHMTGSELHDLADYAQILSEIQAVPRVVALQAKDDLPYGISRMWQVYIDQTGWEVEVFRQRTKAVEWLRERVLFRFGVHVEL